MVVFDISVYVNQNLGDNPQHIGVYLCVYLIIYVSLSTYSDFPIQHLLIVS